MHVKAAGYECRMRPWFCGVADPGTGKSHAADPHVALAEAACRANPTYAPGTAEDSFHVDYSRTYASFEHKLTTTSGYGWHAARRNVGFWLPGKVPPPEKQKTSFLVF